MSTSETNNSDTIGNGQNGSWLRRCHRWLGIAVAAFILLLSCTGIALNHSGDWSLDKRHVSSDWLLNAYGISAPAVSASYSDGVNRATLLGKRLYLNNHEVADDIDTVVGMVAPQGFALIATRNQVLLLTGDGDLVERMDLSTLLPGPIERIGRAGERAVIDSEAILYQSNADISGFEPRLDAATAEITWSATSAVPDDLLKSLTAQYRGRGLSIERLITDVHNGRIVAITGPYLMDAVAILLIILSISGILMWLRPRRKK